jgi:hypothetical protein
MTEKTTFEDYIRTRLEARAVVQMRVGQSEDRSEASFFTWDDKIDGTYFWRVTGNTVELIQFVGSEAKS